MSSKMSSGELTAQLIEVLSVGGKDGVYQQLVFGESLPGDGHQFI